VTTQLQGLKKGEHAYNYQKKYVKDAEKTEKFWLEKMGNYGKGTIIQAKGLIRDGEPNETDHGGWIRPSIKGPIPFKPFEILLMNADTNEVKEYLIARFPNIQKETIELKEFQTGILNV